MDNTQKKLYVVSFGHSDRYLLPTDNAEEAHRILVDLEKKLNQYLKEKYPDETFAYYTYPRVTEVEPSHRDRYDKYLPLDDSAFRIIESVLDREIADMESLQKLNSDAPYDNANPAAAGVGGIL